MLIAVQRAGGVAKLARETGISESVVRKWRAGRSEPTRTNLVNVAHAAGVSVEWLATGQGGRSRSSATYRSKNAHVAELRMDEIRSLVAEEEITPVSRERQAEQPGLHRALLTLREIARNAEIPPITRMRACLVGSFDFGDSELARLHRALESHALRSVARPFTDIVAVLDSAIDEVDYRPGTIMREGLKTAMYSHGLTREGVVTLLQFLQAWERERST